MKDFAAAVQGLTCTLGDPCTQMTCSVPNGHIVMFTVLQCHYPHAAFHLVVLDENGNAGFSHTFTKTETVNTTIDGVCTTLAATLVLVQDAIRLKVSNLSLQVCEVMHCMYKSMHPT